MYRVVIVDDSLVSGLLLKHLVNHVAGVGAIAFQTPLDALTHCALAVPDVVVVDYKMPSLDGLTFVEALRSLPGCADIPVVMVTGEPGIRSHALALGFDAVLGKPVEPAFVRETVIRLLPRRPLAAAAG